MRKTQLTRFLLAFALGFSAYSANAGQTLKIRSDLWCPYACEPGDHPGLILEIVQSILGKKGYKLDYQLVNWPRAIAGAREGTYDAIIGAAPVDAPDFIFPKEAQASVTYEFFTLKDKTWKYSGQLDKIKIGVINSYNYDDTINKLVSDKNPNFVVISGDDAQGQRARMLMAGRIDAVYEAPAVLKSVFQKMKLDPDSLRPAGAPQQQPQLNYIAFSPKQKKSKELAHEIDVGMKQIRKSGELKKILDKYDVKDWM